MAAPFVVDVAKRLLRDVGVMSLSPANPSGQNVELEDGDIADVVMAMNAALQECWDDGPAEISQRPGSGFLNAPTTVTLDVTHGSRTIASLTTFAAWMEGCTIRIEGDNADNEITSSTSLARHYTGSTGTGVSATVYGDSFTLDEGVQHIMQPVWVSDNRNGSGWPLPMANSLDEFMRVGGWPIVADINGRGISTSYPNPLFLNCRKPVGNRPYIWIQDGFYDADSAYLKRRVRFSPMPDNATVMGYVELVTPPRILPEDIHDGSEATLPIPNGWVESIYLPICRQHMTGLSTFQSESAKPEIARAYRAAKARIINSTGAKASVFARYQ